MDTVGIRSGRVINLTTTPITTVTSGPTRYKDSPFTVFQAILTGTGAVTATVSIQGSNDSFNWGKTPLVTFSLTGTNTDNDVLTYTGPCKYVRANVTAITGVGASVTVTAGV